MKLNMYLILATIGFLSGYKKSAVHILSANSIVKIITDMISALINIILTSSDTENVSEITSITLTIIKQIRRKSNVLLA